MNTRKVTSTNPSEKALKPPLENDNKERDASVSVNEVQKKAAFLLISNDFRPEEVLRLDSEGRQLMFEQKEEFVVLEDALVAQLSKDNKQRYHLAKQFHDAWYRSDLEQRTAGMEVDIELNGSASTKLDTSKNHTGMYLRWTTRENIADRLAKGYKILQAHEVQTYLGAQGNRHTITKNGKAELVLMGKPQKLYKQEQEKKVVKNEKIANVWKESGVTELQRYGAVNSMVATNERSDEQWNDIEQE